jgi:hypothetical protein
MPRILASANRVAYHGLPKYTFARHGGNNSAWTTDHRLLDAETLVEYLRVFNDRAEWLSKRFPDNAAYWRYFNWSFRISMVEKVARLNLTDCAAIAAELRQELVKCRNEFLASPHILDFEKEWMEAYVSDVIRKGLR